MEIVAGILIVASVVLPILLVLAIITFVGFLAHSWATDLRAEPADEPEIATATGRLEGAPNEAPSKVPAPA